MGMTGRWFRRRPSDDEMREELEAHVAMRAEHDRVDEAVARRRLGNMLHTRESMRRVWIAGWWDALRQDAWFTWRSWRRQPGFALGAVLVLALGIGANTAVFAIADQALFRFLPVDRPQELVLLQWDGQFIGGSSRGGRLIDGSSRGTSDVFAYPTYLDLRDGNPGVLAGLAARRQEAVTIGLASRAERGLAELVSGNYFQVLGVRAHLGRTFGQSDDDERDGEPYVVLSHAYWRQQFGGDPSVVNNTIRVNGHALTVVGVAEEGFHGFEPLSPSDLFVPLAMKGVVTPTWDDRERRDSIWLNIVGRLAPGVDRRTAASKMGGAYLTALRKDLDAHARGGLGLKADFRERYLRNTLVMEDAGRGAASVSEEPIYALLAMVGILLLTACVNVASLVVTRGAKRRREMAVRASLGASYASLLRLAMSESVLLAAAGGGVGLLAAGPMARALIELMPSERLAQAISTTPDWRIVAFTGAVSLFTAVLFGLAPAVHTSRSDALPVLKSQSATFAPGRSGSRFRRALVAAQVALSLLLLTAAGLFARNLHALFASDPGFETSRLLSFTIDPSQHGYTPERWQQLALDGQHQLGQIPGVEMVSGAAFPVLQRLAWQNTIRVEGHAPAPGESRQAYWNKVLPGFFSTVGVRLLAGREFTEADTAPSARYAAYGARVVVNETFATRFFASPADAIGRRIGFGGTDAPLAVEIIGVVEDVKGVDLKEAPWPATFTSALADSRPGGLTFYLRSQSDPRSLAGQARRAVEQLDPELAVYDLQALDAQVEETHFIEILFSELSTAFAALATLLASVGLYGVAALAAAHRTQEFGVRIALGAPRAHVLALTLRELLWITAGGVGAGAALAIAFGRIVGNRVAGVDAFDPVVTAGAILTVAVVSLLAGVVPARRAARVDPVAALQAD